MRILVLGAGATGGYFGGRLLEAGRDVTFLVRDGRAKQLAATGLVIDSPCGSATLPAPTVLAGDIDRPYDLVILCNKAYDLDSAMETVAPAIGPETLVMPLLNGLRHFDALDARFGHERVLGGFVSIIATLGEAGRIVQMGELHSWRFGARSPAQAKRIAAVAALMEGATMDARPSADIYYDMWDKWVLVAALAACTCLMRAAVGDIVAAPGGQGLVEEMLESCAAIAAANGYRLKDEHLARTHTMLTKAGSAVTASMLRDIERGGPIEADHMLGDLIARAEAKGVATPLLRIAYCHVKAYEARRAREEGGD
jgi:2-dehydropantoate 2-reductase